MEIIRNKGINRCAFWILSIIMFLVVFNPPFFANVSFTIIAVVSSFFMILFNFKIFKRNVELKSVRTLLIFFLYFFGYYSVVAMFCFMETLNNDIMSCYQEAIIGFVSIFLVTFAIVIYVTKKNIGFDNLSKQYIAVGIIQTVFVFSSLVSPTVKSFFNDLTMMNSSSTKIASSMEYTAAYRNFGFASTLYDIFGFTMAVLGVIAFNQAVKGKKLFYLLSFAFAIASGVNARSGFVIYIIGIMLLSFLPGGKKKQNHFWGRFLLIAGLLVCIYFGALLVLKDTTSEQMSWLASGITQTQSFSGGKSEGYYDMLLNDFIFFPDGASLFFGTGMPPHLAIHKQSDVGYIQNIWQYGIIGSFLLYLFYWKMFILAIQNLQWPESALIKAITVMVAVYLIKLTCLGYSMASLIFMPLCLCAISQSSKPRTKYYVK